MKGFPEMKKRKELFVMWMRLETKEMRKMRRTDEMNEMAEEEEK
jgi:hypothetical protein